MAYIAKQQLSKWYTYGSAAIVIFTLLLMTCTFCMACCMRHEEGKMGEWGREEGMMRHYMMMRAMHERGCERMGECCGEERGECRGEEEEECCEMKKGHCEKEEDECHEKAEEKKQCEMKEKEGMEKKLDLITIFFSSSAPHPAELIFERCVWALASCPRGAH